MKFKYAKLEDIPEALRSYYAQGGDGAYYLQVEGAVAKERLDEFRNNNVTLQQQLEAFKGLDPTKVAEMLENERKIAEKKLIDAGDIEGLVNQRVSTMKTTYDTQVNDLQGKLSTTTRQLEVLLIDNSVREQATKLGVAPTAVDDVLLRAKTVFKVEEGRPVAKDAQGNVIYGKDGQTSLGLGEWIGGLKEQAPHLFGPSAGSGSNNNNRGGAPDKTNMSASQKIAAGMQTGSSILT